jgi:ubiquitin carboxyl-terminal hydrolase 22/27/51
VFPERHSARLEGPSFPSQWCRFDDDKVTPATLAKLLGTSAQIYMALYVKRRLDYKPHPSYVLTRESEAMREREALAAKARAE